MADDVTNPFAAIMSALDSKGRGTRGVRKDGKPGKVNPVLTSQEVSRYEKIFGIMKEVVNPDPEARKVSDTAVGGDMGSQMAAMGSNSGGSGGGSNLAGLLGLVGTGLLGTALAIVTDTGHLATMALKLTKLIPIKMLKVLPLVGSLINFGFAYEAFTNNKPLEGLWELTSGIAGLFPGVGTAISVGMDMVKFMYEHNNPKDPDTGERKIKFGPWLKQKGKELGAVVWQKIVDGKVPLLSGLYQFGLGIGKMAALDFKGGLEEWNKIIPAMLGQGDNEDFLRSWDAFTTMAGEGLNTAYQKGKEIAGDSWGWIKGVFEKIGETFQGLFNAMSDWIGDMVDQGKDIIWGMIPDALKPTKKLDLETRRRAAWNAQQQMRQQKRDREMTAEEQRAEEILHLTPMEMKAFKSSGKLPSEIEDGYISKNGNVTAYHSEDDILAARRGGPIDKMLDGNSKTMSTISDINKNQLAVLMQIRDGINALVSQSGGTKTSDMKFSSNKLTTEFYA